MSSNNIDTNEVSISLAKDLFEKFCLVPSLKDDQERIDNLALLLNKVLSDLLLKYKEKDDILNDDTFDKDVHDIYVMVMNGHLSCGIFDVSNMFEDFVKGETNEIFEKKIYKRIISVFFTFIK